MPSLDALIELAQPWAKFYSKSHVAQNIIMFTHLAGMLGGGGLAIAADRAMWRARTATDDVRKQLMAEVQKVHTPVLIGLAMAGISGVLLTFSDVEAYLPSKVYWMKMTAFALLLINGAWLKSMEQGVHRTPATMGTVWPKLTLASRFSWVLWFAVVLGGVMLMNA